METSKTIEKRVKKVYERFLNGADVWVHKPRRGGRIDTQRISDLDIRAVKDVEGSAHVFLNDPIQYEALITAVLIATDVYKFYQPAIENALKLGDQVAALEMFFEKPAAGSLFMMLPYGDLRLGGNGFLSSHDAPWYQVPDEVKPVEAAIAKIIGDPCYNDEYAFCDKCHHLIHLIPDTFCGGLDHIDIERFSGGSMLHYRYHSACISEKAALDAYAYRYTHLSCIVQRGKIVGLPDRFGSDLVEMPETYETGLHGGEKEDPWKILKALNQVGISAWLRIHPSQFSVSFNILVRPRFATRAMAILAGTNTSLGYDPGDSLKAALQGNARIVEHPSSYPGEHNILYQVIHADAAPVVDVYRLSTDEVIDRGFPR